MTDDRNQEQKRQLPAKRTSKKRKSTRRKAKTNPGREAVMTLVAIMKEDEDPRMQIAAAKALLGRGAGEASAPESLPELSEDDIDAVINAAKKLLEELASRKSGGVPGAGELADTGAPGADHPAG